MSSLIFFTDNSSRKTNFRIATKIFERKDGNEVVKIAENKVSEKHLAQMLETYQTLKADEKKVCSELIPVSAKRKDRAVVFPFVQGKNAERVLIDSLLADDKETVLNIINKLIITIDSLQSTKVNPANSSKFVEVFGSSYSNPVECARLGLVDLNLDNIIIDGGGKWSLIDYEWAFNFPVPKVYLIQRFFYWFFAQRYTEILSLHNKQLKLINLSDSLVIPEYVYTRYKKYLQNMDKTFESESFFQHYVHGSHMEPEAFFGAPQPFTDKSVSDLQALVDSNVKLTNQVAELQDGLSEALGQLGAIRGSKKYKMLEKLASTKNRLIGKK